MRRLDALKCVRPACRADLVKSSRVLAQPFTEHDIIETQSMFLTNGFQHIEVKNPAMGRSIINTFLSSLNCYHDCACLSGVNIPLNASVCDIYRVLVGMAHDGHLDQGDIEEFFLEDFYFDVLWIELTEQLKQQPWFAHFNQLLITFKIDQHIPIIMVTYINEN